MFEKHWSTPHFIYDGNVNNFLFSSCMDKPSPTATLPAALSQYLSQIQFLSFNNWCFKIKKWDWYDQTKTKLLYTLEKWVAHNEVTTSLIS